MRASTVLEFCGMLSFNNPKPQMHNNVPQHGIDGILNCTRISPVKSQNPHNLMGQERPQGIARKVTVRRPSFQARFMKPIDMSPGF